MLSNLTIKSKVLLLSIIPVVFILILAFKSVSSDYDKVNDLSSLNNGVTLSTEISSLVHETQKERGLTAGYLGSKGKKFLAILKQQYKSTDKKLLNLKAFISTFDVLTINKEVSLSLNNAIADIEKRTKIRQNVISLSIPLGKALSYYTIMNKKYLNIVIDISKVSKSPVITKQLIAYSNFLLSKENAGIERAVGTNVLSTDNFTQDMRIKFNNLISSQNSYIHSFLQYASSDSKIFYDNTLKGKEINEVNRIRKTLIFSSKKHQLISNMKNIVGYGGLIHHFKNYVIRGKVKHSKKVNTLYVELIEYITKYKNLENISNEEKSLLTDIENIFTVYYKGLPKVSEAILLNESVKKIDKVVIASDKEAILALNTLDHSLFSVDASYWFKVMSYKINLLKKIDDYLADELVKTIKIEYDNANSSFYTVLISSIVGILFILIFSIFIIKLIIKTLDDFSDGLLEFFRYVNKESTSVSLLHENSTEIGKMSKLVNQNIKKIKIGIEEEREVVSKTIELLREFEEGDLSKRIDTNVSNEALKELTTLLNKMGDNMEKNINNVLNILEDYSSYNYMKKINSTGLKAHILKLSNGVNSLGDSITQMLVENKKTGLTLASSSSVLLKNVEIVNQSTNLAASSLEETSASLEEITSTILTNSSSISKMSDYAKELRDKTSHGEEQANKTVASMDEINEQVSAINDSIGIIDQISFQTNILSLNAAVEAATAGEAGKGFAVVAQEVRNLASRSAQAAKEIKILVENANLKASEGKKIANNMIEGYSLLNENIVKTIDLIASVEKSSKEQQTGIEHINEAIGKQDEQTQKIASSASQTYEIAMNTSSISSKIVEKADEKEFLGKQEIV